jgi:hypothetical protein
MFQKKASRLQHAIMQTIKRTEHDIYPYISATGRLAGAAKGKLILITGGGKGIGRVHIGKRSLYAI